MLIYNFLIRQLYKMISLIMTIILKAIKIIHLPITLFTSTGSLSGK